MIQVYDNLISPTIIEECEKYFTSPELYYTYYTQTSRVDNKITDTSLYDLTQSVFVSHIIDNNKNRLPKSAELVRKLLKEIENKTENNFVHIMRAQVNCTNPTVSSLPSVPHTDQDESHIVLIYYISDSDGDTIFYDDDFNIIKTCSPVKGRFVIFNGDIFHSATPPKKNNTRFVININLKGLK